MMTKKIKMMTRSTWEDKGDKDDFEDTEINDNEDEDEREENQQQSKVCANISIAFFVAVRLLWHW